MDFSKIIPLNNNVICKKVKYGDVSKVDLDDTSHLFYEVVVPTEALGVFYGKGDLVKSSVVYSKDVDINGETYNSLDAGLLVFKINAEDVKK